MSIQEARVQIERGLSFHRQGQSGLAQSHYQRAVKLDAKNADGWHLLGLAAYQLGHPLKAIKHYRQALLLRAQFPEALNNLAIALKSIDDFAAAEVAFARALEIRPEYVEAAHNLGMLKEARGDLDGAQNAYFRALTWRPNAVESLTNLGNLFRKLGNLPRARELLQKAVALAPSGMTLVNLALVLLDQGQSKLALEYAQRALQLAPDSIDALAALGTAARMENALDLAASALPKVVALSPNSAGALHELALTENALGHYRSACTLLARASKIAPENESLRWNTTFLLPVLVEDAEECALALQRFESGLTEFSKRVDWHRIAPEALMQAVLSTSTFELAYLPGATKGLQQRFGQLLSKVVNTYVKPRTALPQQSVECAKPSTTTKTQGVIRVGVISSYLRSHTVMRYFQGFIDALCAHSQIECWIWFTGAHADAVTAHLQGNAQHFVHANWPPLQVISDVLASELDVMIYPDIGMDSQQHFFATWRLAPVQAMLYGHPMSSGLPEVDLYFSAAALEPEHAALDYTEKLICLSGLGAALIAPDYLAATPSDETIENRAKSPEDKEVVRLICAQNLAKLTPEFDVAVAQILSGSTARMQFFDRQPRLSLRYLKRLSATLERFGVEENRVSLIPACAYHEFVQHLRSADLILDSPWFSGGATSLDAICVGTPVLSWTSSAARGRQTLAMLSMLEVPELIAADAKEFVEKALALIEHPASRERLRTQLTGKTPQLFSDQASREFVETILQLH